MQGLVPTPGAVATGDVHKPKDAESANGVDEKAAGAGAGAGQGAGAGAGAGAGQGAGAGAGALVNGEKSQPTDQKDTGLEKQMNRLSTLSNSSTGLGTAPGAPAGDVVFDHPPSKNEIKQARASIEGTR